MSIFGKAAHFMGKAKTSGGFGFKDKVQEAGKKMYGYGQKAKGFAKKYPGATIGGAGLATVGGLTAGGVLEADWDGSKQFGSEDISKQQAMLQTAIVREIQGNQSRDHHLDNLKVIRNFALNNPERFTGFVEMLKSSDKGMAFANQLRNSYAEYKDKDMVNLIGQ